MKKYQYLNLEQKMAKIRKKMPSLLKKFHNDEADYDFATLDDIYESMTPALNKYGVNFDIIHERPTQYDKKKRPVYLTLDKDGFWRYESDLELCWTNIDNPEEERRVVIHIIGTHEIPDKAHGTAMTYGLKYYFRNKFCMRQIDSVKDDPDGMEYHTDECSTGSKERSSSKVVKGKSPESEKSDLEKQAKKEMKKTADSKGNRLSGNICSELMGAVKASKAEKNDPEKRRTEMPVDGNSGYNREKQSSGSSKSCTDTKNQGEKEPQKSTDNSQNSTAEKEPEHSGQQRSVDKEIIRAQTVEQKEAAGKQTAERKEPAGQQTAERKEAAGKQTAEQKEATKQQAAVSKQSEDTGDGFQAAKEEEVPFEDASFMDELEQGLEEETKDADSSLETAKNYICTFGIYDGKTLGDIMNSGIKGRETVKWIAYRYHGADAAMVNAAKLLVENPDAVIEQQAA